MTSNARIVASSCRSFGGACNPFFALFSSLQLLRLGDAKISMKEKMIV
jgi:hypothetical protein